MAHVDVVIVSYNSSESIRGAVEPLSRLDWVDVVVVDNASTDGSPEVIEDLPVRALKRSENLGFANGCNFGWQNTRSEFVLFLNPDARIDELGLRRLLNTLETRPEVALVAPRVVGPNGQLHFSLRRFPRLRSTFAQAFYVHRLVPWALWADEAIRRTEVYDRPGTQEWVSGACMLVRRSVLERLGGWDDGFFLYCEDIDLCRRIWDLGLSVYFEPRATVVHMGGMSAPRSTLLPHLAASRVRYARIHRAWPVAICERIGIALEATTRLVVGRGGRGGHARSLGIALGAHQPQDIVEGA